jgi:hypothetical protein
VTIIEDAGSLGRVVMTSAREGADRSPGDPVASTRAAYELWFSVVDSDEEVLRMHIRERDHSDGRVRAVLARTRSAWIDSWAESFRRFGGGQPAFDPESAARMVVALGLGLLVVYLDAPPEDRPALRDQLIASAVPFTLGGFVGLGTTRPPAG